MEPSTSDHSGRRDSDARISARTYRGDTLAVDLEPHGLLCNVPPTLVINYKDCDVSDQYATGMLYSIVPSQDYYKKWMVVGTINHFSVYAPAETHKPREGHRWSRDSATLRCAASAEQQIENHDQNNEIEDATTVVADAGTDVVASAPDEQEEKNQDDDQHTGPYSTMRAAPKRQTNTAVRVDGSISITRFGRWTAISPATHSPAR